MPSGYEDTAVDQIEFADLSDEELQNIAENDDRTTAQEAAQKELNKRGAGDADADADEPASADDEQAALVADKQRRLLINPDNASGLNNDLDVGQNEVQAKMDEAEISGVIPPTGGPPSAALTVAGVTNDQEAVEEAESREAAEERFEKLHGRAPGDPVV